jgi:hypothetical protein
VKLCDKDYDYFINKINHAFTLAILLISSVCLTPRLVLAKDMTLPAKLTIKGDTATYQLGINSFSVKLKTPKQNIGSSNYLDEDKGDQATLLGNCLLVSRSVKSTEVGEVAERIELYGADGKVKKYEKGLLPFDAHTSPSKDWSIVVESTEDGVFG